MPDRVKLRATVAGTLRGLRHPWWRERKDALGVKERASWVAKVAVIEVSERVRLSGAPEVIECGRLLGRVTPRSVDRHPCSRKLHGVCDECPMVIEGAAP